jgi:hypothetical protein
MNVLVALSGRFGLPLLRRTHPIGYDLTIGGFKWNDGNLLMSLNARQSGSQVSLAAAKRRSRRICDQCQHALSRWVREQEGNALGSFPHFEGAEPDQGQSKSGGATSPIY